MEQETLSLGQARVEYTQELNYKFTTMQGCLERAGKEAGLRTNQADISHNKL